MRPWSEEERRRAADLTPGERLARRKPNAGHFTADEVSELLGTKLELGVSGPPMEDVRTEPDRDYADDTDLIYTRGGTGFRTRLTKTDVVNVIAALSGAMPTASEVVAGFLAERLAKARANENLACGEIGPGPDVRALERVIAMLEKK